jgi:hypothetical protein
MATALSGDLKGIQPSSVAAFRAKSSAHVKAEKSLPHNDLVSILQRLEVSGQQPLPSINKRAVGRSQIFQELLPVAKRNSGMTARYLRLRVIRVEVNVGKDTSIGIPAADLRLNIAKRKFLAQRTATLYHQPGMWAHFGAKGRSEIDPRVGTAGKFRLLDGRGM